MKQQHLLASVVAANKTMKILHLLKGLYGWRRGLSKTTEMLKADKRVLLVARESRIKPRGSVYAKYHLWNR
jgi:hypothetical protein